MITAKLIDNIWATRKADALNGFKLMLAEEIGGKDHGELSAQARPQVKAEEFLSF